MSTMYNFWKNIRWFGEFLLLFGLFLMSLYTFTCSFYGCFVLSIHLNNYVADQNKSHCYFCSLVTFTYAWVFFPVATVRILKNILCLYTDTVIGEFQKRYKTTRINCNEFLLLLNFIEFFFVCSFSLFRVLTCNRTYSNGAFFIQPFHKIVTLSYTVFVLSRMVYDVFVSKIFDNYF